MCRFWVARVEMLWTDRRLKMLEHYCSTLRIRRSPETQHRARQTFHVRSIMHCAPKQSHRLSACLLVPQILRALDDGSLQGAKMVAPGLFRGSFGECVERHRKCKLAVQSIAVVAPAGDLGCTRRVGHPGEMVSSHDGGVMADGLRKGGRPRDVTVKSPRDVSDFLTSFSGGRSIGHHQIA